METLKKFPKIQTKVNEVLALNGEIYEGSFSQFDRALTLSKLVNEVCKELKETAWNIIRETETANWKEFISNLLNLSYSYIARLCQVQKLTPEHISNYREYCRINAITPDIKGLLNFGKEETPKFKSELIINYGGKTSKINKDGIFQTALSESEIENLIAYLSAFIGK